MSKLLFLSLVALCAAAADENINRELAEENNVYGKRIHPQPYVGGYGFPKGGFNKQLGYGGFSKGYGQPHFGGFNKHIGFNKPHFGGFNKGIGGFGQPHFSGKHFAHGKGSIGFNKGFRQPHFGGFNYRRYPHVSGRSIGHHSKAATSYYRRLSEETEE